MKTIFSLFLTTLIVSYNNNYGQTLQKKETVNLNGIELYYEVYGQGKPLILLHGWTQSSQIWAEYIPEYANHFKVYAVDLRGHGRTSPLTKDFSIKSATEDIAALMNYLSLENARAIGLSYGGIVLLQLADLHPDKMASMVLVGASHNYSGQDNQELADTFKFENLPSAFIGQLRKLHFHGEDQIKALFDPNLNYTIRLSNEDLKAIKSRTLIVSGDRDEIVGTNTAFELHKSLPDSELWIIPNAGHMPINGRLKSEFLRITMSFLKGNK